MEELTRTVLEDVARWKRTGVLPTRCSLCGCGEDNHHAETCPSYVAPPGLMVQSATLRVLTTDYSPPLPDPCDGTYLCDCPGCRDQRADLLKRRPVRQPWQPVRRAA